MKWAEKAVASASCLVLLALAPGCTVLYHAPASRTEPPPPAVVNAPRAVSFQAAPPPLQRVSCLLPADSGLPANASPIDRNQFAALKELSVEGLVQQVLARNPSLTQMTAALQAASFR